METGWIIALSVIGSAVFALPSVSLETVLTPDGAIVEGTSGSFDPMGFRLTCGPRGEPVFTADTAFSREAVHLPEGQDCAEGYWDNRFGPMGINDKVWAIAVSGSAVYVGGCFSHAGGVPANYIARWDGSSWSALGSGLNGYVSAIAVSGSNVYAGGTFSQAGGVSAHNIARWNGTSWFALGSGVTGVDEVVLAIAASGTDLYVGGRFYLAGGSYALNIARWNGSSWSALGNGVSGGSEPHVETIALSGSDVYVGGKFLNVGGLFDSPNIACWVSAPAGIEPPVERTASTIHISPNPMTTGTYLSFQSIGPAPITLKIYDTTGRLLGIQELGTLPNGSQTHYWDALDEGGAPLASGVYFLQLASTDFQASTRAVLVR